jgi:hypothetical protein
MVVEDEPRPEKRYEELKTKLVVFENELNKDINQPQFHKVSHWREVDKIYEALHTEAS